ncbi:MAG: M24 family metallopeptidase [Isosphaeraceae bacterium]
MLSIRAMERCTLWSEVASLMERYVKSQGMAVIEKFVGHGIGQNMHEEPQVPNFVSSAEPQRHPPRTRDRPGDRADGRPGDPEVRTLADGWTVEAWRPGRQAPTSNTPWR